MGIAELFQDLKIKIVNPKYLPFVDKLLIWGRRNSLWLLVLGIKCCTIEDIMVPGAANYDFERFGVLPRNSPRQCDLMIISGPITQKLARPIKVLYEQMAEPRYVIATGECSICGGPWKGMYSIVDGVDQIIPVDVYIPGCPPKPEALIEGIIKLEEKILKGEVRKKFLPKTEIPKIKEDWRS
jgi:NADH-quinone oxidoreductase subunit B